MSIAKFVHWQDGDMFLGYLMDHPDYWTQGETLEELSADFKFAPPSLLLPLGAGGTPLVGSGRNGRMRVEGFTERVPDRGREGEAGLMKSWG